MATNAEILGSQIRLVLSNVTSANFRSVTAELHQLIAPFGADGLILVFQVLLDDLLKISSNIPKDNTKLVLFQQELAALNQRPEYVHVLSRVFLQVPRTADKFLMNFSKQFKLSLLHEYILASAWVFSSDDFLQAQGISHLIIRLKENPVSMTEAGLSEIVLRNLFAIISRNANLRGVLDNPAIRDYIVSLAEQNPSYSYLLAKSDDQLPANQRLLGQEKEMSTAGVGLPSSIASQSIRAIPVSKTVQDLGYIATASVQIFRSILSQFPPLQDMDIISLISMVCRTHTGLEPSMGISFNANGTISIGQHVPVSSEGLPTQWNLDVLVAVLKEFIAPNRQLWISLDSPTFYIDDQKGFAMFMAIFRGLSGGPQVNFPLGIIFKKWQNTQSQISFLRFAILSPPEMFSFAESPRRLPTGDATVSMMSKQPILHAWISVDLIEILIELCSIENYVLIRSLFDLAIKNCADILFLGVSSLTEHLNRPIVQDLSSVLLLLYLGGHHISNATVARVWQMNRNLLISAMVTVYQREPTLLTRILDLAQELKGLTIILDYPLFHFTIDLASLASRREYLNLEKWLRDRIIETPQSQQIVSLFITECLIFLRERLPRQFKVVDTHRSPQHPFQSTISAFITVLQSKAQLLSPEQATEFKNIRLYYQQMFSNIDVTSASTQPQPTATPQGESALGFPPEIESRANAIFQNTYSNAVSIEEVIETLRGYKNSAEPQDSAVYNCMIQSLFDEHKYFPKYPEKELRITAILFGQLINHNLISPALTQFALNLVLDSLKKQPNTKMFKFGFMALEQFKRKLPEFQGFVSQILQIPNIRQIPEMLDIIIMIGQPVASETSPSPAPAAKPSREPSIVTSLNVNLLLEAAPKVTQLPDELRDKVHFIWNNLSQTNLEQKAQAFRDLLDVQLLPAISQYVVINRASMEPNFHKLYLGFLDTLNMTALNRMITQVTIDSIRVLLTQDVKVGSTEKTLLKNLGSWLGSITIAKNKPILHKNIAIKELILDAYDRDNLTSVIPFVCKVLESCNRSKVFKHFNPWVFSILRLLVEIHSIPDIKLHIKFDIEMLFREITIEFKDVPPSDICRNRRNPAPAVVTETTSPGGLDPKIWPLFASKIQINFPTPDILPIPQSRAMVLLATQKAIQDIMNPVVDRSASIACITTKELVCKDFATDADEARMKQAAQSMAQSLAGNLALVACKDPLRASMANYIRQLLQQERSLTQSNPPDRIMQIIDMATQAMSNDNVDLASSIIEKAAMDKATKDIEERLSQSFAARRRGRDTQDQPFVDPNAVNHARFSASLPEILRPKVSGLTSSQLRIYDDFSRLRNIRGDMEENGISGAPSGNLAVIINALGELDQLLSRTTSENINPTTDQNFTRVLRNLLVLLQQAQPLDDILHNVAFRIFKRLYELENRLQVEIYISILDQIQKLGQKQDITGLFIRMEDEKKFHFGIVATLSRLQYFNVPEICDYLSKLLQSSSNPAHVDFAIEYTRKCIIDDQSATLQDVSSILETLQSKAVTAKAPEKISKFLEEIRILQNSDDRNRLARLLTRLSRQEPIESAKPQDPHIKIFLDWSATLGQPQGESTSERLLAEIQSLQYLRGDEPGNVFFRTVARYCVDEFYSSQTSNLQAIDDFAKFVVVLVKSTNDAAGVIAKVDLLSRILDSVIIVLARDHETRKIKFNQRPYLRLFSTWLQDFNQPDALLDLINFQVLVRFSTAFQAISPLRFPGFAFAWLELISNRMFMPKLLFSKAQKGWPYFQHLLVDLFKFLEPYLRNADLKEPIKLLYTGTLRTLLVLLHDFPEFLCDYHFSFCDVIPPTCVQMRNLILAAFPRNVRLPDPFTPNLKVDLLPEINHPPRVLSSYTTALTQANIKTELEIFLKTRQPLNFPMELRTRLSLQSMGQSGLQYNVPLINAVVLHIGIQVTTLLQSRTSNASPFAHNASMDIFQYLSENLDSEGRYLFLNAIANQLRYPNTHTHYFSCILLYLFAEAKEDITREQITRVLLERLVVSRPHPWGLLITFIELIKNSRYNFWNHSFTRCAPEIERLFESVAQHPVNPNHQATGGAAPTPSQ